MLYPFTQIPEPFPFYCVFISIYVLRVLPLPGSFCRRGSHIDALNKSDYKCLKTGMHVLSFDPSDICACAVVAGSYPNPFGGDERSPEAGSGQSA